MTEPLPHNDDTEKIEKMVTMTIAAVKGLVPPVQVAVPLAQIAQGDLAPPEARVLALALGRILRGERDPVALVEDLPPQLAEVVWDTLEQIDAPLPEEPPTEWVGLTFEELIEKVAAACAGEVLLWQQLWEFTGKLAADETAPPEIRQLSLVLRKILAGERQKFILDDLTARHRWAVEQLLDWLSGN